MKTSFGLTFIDLFGNNNINDDTIISLPAILSVAWFNNGTFTITVKDKNTNIVTEHTGVAEKDATQYWDLNLSIESEIWHIHVDFEPNESGTKEQITKIVKIDRKSIKTEEEIPVPPIDDISDLDQSHRFRELDAHWLKIDPDKNLFRFVYNDYDKPINDPTIEWVTPILLVHGYKANHLTWNSLVSQVWLTGFRNIFATEILDPSKIDENVTYLTEITEFLFEITGLTKYIIVAHSLGAFIARYYIQSSKGQESTMLFISIASPQYGLFKGIKSSIYSLLGKTARKLKSEAINDDTALFYKNNEKQIPENIYNETSVNINGSVLSLGGSDGVFKPQTVPEMINFVFNKNHLSLNKCDETITVVKDLLLKKAKIYKLKLLSIKSLGNVKRRSFSFVIKADNPLIGEKTTIEQVYPRVGYVELSDKLIYEPKEPKVLFTNYITEKQSIEVMIEIYSKIHTFIKKEMLVIPVADKEAVNEIFEVKTKSKYLFKFESYSYKIKYIIID